jgi:protein phosphatase
MTSPVSIRYAARSDIGRCRESNADAAYAGPRLLAVADGMGGAGQRASAAVIDALKQLETVPPAGDLLNALDDAISRAGAAVGDLAGEGTGSTITALLLSGSQLALVHIGDTRAYLLRGGELRQITHDHTVVQSLLDEGKITPAEAASHPQRSLLLRAIDGTGGSPNVALREVEPGDRYLLCSDGLSGVVAPREIHQVLAAGAEPERTVRRLIELANAAGGPDNIACVVADVAGEGSPGTAG